MNKKEKELFESYKKDNDNLVNQIKQLNKTLTKTTKQLKTKIDKIIIYQDYIDMIKSKTLLNEYELESKQTTIDDIKYLLITLENIFIDLNI